jgi:hypothetical protein
VTGENINSQLATSGLEMSALSQPVVETVRQEPPQPQPTQEPETTPSENTCRAGTYSSFDKTKCVNCPAGTFSTFTNAESFSICVACVISTYSSAIGADSSNTCISCEEGKFTSRSGSTWIGQCTVSPSMNTC